MLIEGFSAEMARAGSEIRAREVVVAAPTVTPDMRAGDVFTMLANRDDRPSLAVVDRDRRILGLVDRARLLSTFGQTFGRSVYENRPVHKLMDPHPMIVPAEMGVDHVVEMIANRYPSALTSGFVVTEDEEYFGIGLPIQLMSKVALQANRRSKELEQAHREAEAANQAKSVFLATVSHEIRTPLNGVIGNLELIRFTKLSPDQAELVDSAEVSAQTLLGIIGDVLDFSKIEAGRITFETIEMSTAVLLEDVRNLLISKAIQKGLTIETYIGPNVPDKVHGDPFRLRQVLMNFVGNAVKFTESGGIFITVSAPGHTVDGRVRLRFECTDTGRGFAPEKAESLFQEFIQEDSSTTRKFGGTGLGLAICRKVVELMDGQIGAIGVPQHGAKFWAEIPFKAVGEERRPRAISLSGIRAILVDGRSQDGVVRGGTGGAPEIATAASIDSAARRLAHDAAKGLPTHVILVSERLPDGDFRQAAQRLARPDTVLVLVSGGTDPTLEYRAYRAGYKVVLPKSVDVPMLQHVLAHAAGRLSARRPTTSEEAESDPLEVMLAKSDKHLPILVIDDTEMNRLVARRQLGRLGLTCDEAANGKIALQMMTEKRYGLAFVDMAMPVMDGLQFAREVRIVEAGSSWHTPLVAMTGNVQESDRRAALDAGMDDFLTKPVRIEKIAEKLARFLPHASGHAEGTIDEMDFGSIGPQLDLDALDAMVGDGAFEEGFQPDAANDTALPDRRPDAGRATAPPKSGPQNALDLDLLKQNLGISDTAILVEILGTFLTSFDDLAHRIDLAVEHRDRDALRKAAHAAKGAARNAAAMELGMVMAEIEATASNASFDALQGLAQQGAALYAQAKAIIQSLAAAA